MSKFEARVLVVDDYLMNQQLTQRMLERLGCEVELADDGEEALEFHEDSEYDLILMDIQLPDYDGYEVTKKIRKAEGQEKHTPIIALTDSKLSNERELFI